MKGVRGFTLVEMLVAMAITSLLVMLLMGFLYYVFRIEQAVRLEADKREPDLRSAAWLRDAISGCLPVAAEDPSGSAFSGGPNEMRCETTLPLSAQSPRTPARIALTIKKSEAETGTKLVYQDDEGVGPVDLLLSAYPGLTFAYIGSSGKQVDRWPLQGQAEERLPRIVQLIAMDGDKSHIVAMFSPWADPWLAPDVSRVIGFGMR
jgi:prepilin-type N-terminal cleavage/methylation domain-containing protein